MSRQLLTSEKSILIEAGVTPPPEVLASQSIWRELHVPPHQSGQRQWFNTDFVVEFMEAGRREERQVTSVPVRPLTLGADFFVQLSADGMPIMIELLEGESIPVSSFAEEVQRIDRALQSATELPRRLSSRQVPYLRIARLSRSVAFLLSSTTAISEVLSATPVYVASAEGTIEHRSAGGEILIDGVLHD